MTGPVRIVPGLVIAAAGALVAVALWISDRIHR